MGIKHAKAIKHILEVHDIKLPKAGESFYDPLTQDHFGAIYAACEKAAVPTGLPFHSGDWSRTLVLFAMTTGWRISEILALRCGSDVNLETGRIVTRAGDNKGGRTEDDFLPQLTIDHLKRIRSFGKLVFDWTLNSKALYNEFARIQEAAGIRLDCLVDLEANPEYECSDSVTCSGSTICDPPMRRRTLFACPTPSFCGRCGTRASRLRCGTSTSQSGWETAADVLIPNLNKREGSDRKTTAGRTGLGTFSKPADEGPTCVGSKTIRGFTS